MLFIWSFLASIQYELIRTYLQAATDCSIRVIVLFGKAKTSIGETVLVWKAQLLPMYPLNAPCSKSLFEFYFIESEY